MADLFSAIGQNYSVKTPGNGIAGRTVVVSVAGSGGNVSQTELTNVVRRITMQSAPGAGVAAADAFTVAGISGTIGSGLMYLALQGTGTVGTDAGDYASGVTVTVVADFPGLSG